jgi:hypothetical protein
MSTKRQVTIALVIGAVIAIAAWALYRYSGYSSPVGAYATIPGVLAAIPFWGVHGDDNVPFWLFVITVNTFIYSALWFALLRIGFGEGKQTT